MISRSSWRFAAAITASITLAGATQAQKAASTARPAAAVLPYTKVVLQNGLTALLNEDHTLPVVAFDLYFKFGSRDDTPGRIGIAHMCEHLYTDGSPNSAVPMPAFYRAIGGQSPNYAATIEDITHLFVTLPANQLETAIWAEADRLAKPFALADSARVAATRPVLVQERQQRIENPPVIFGAVFSLIAESLFPSGHPYGISAASPLPDLPKIGVADVAAACGPYYVPNNAVLGISGDFNTATVKRWLTKYFGAIPRGAAPNRAIVPAPRLAAAKRVVVEDNRINAPQLRMAWVGAAYGDPDRIPLLALSSVLSLGRFAEDGHLNAVGVEPPTSLGRLSKTLIDDRQLATRVIVNDYDLQHSGVFTITVYPRPNASLTTIETVVDSVLDDVKTHPITTQEIARFSTYNDVYLPTTLESRFLRADTLAHELVYAGDPTAYAKQAAAARALTPADLERARKRFVVPERVVMSIVPAGKLDLIAKPNLPYANITPSYAVQKR